MNNKWQERLVFGNDLHHCFQYCGISGIPALLFHVISIFYQIIGANS